MLFIRAQSAIRADGAPSAQVRSQQFEVSSYVRGIGARPLRAPGANRVFGADERRIRTKYTVMDKINGSAGVLFKIATLQQRGRDLSSDIDLHSRH